MPLMRTPMAPAATMLAAALTLATPLAADPVEHIYQARVPLAGRTPDDEGRAMEAAFRQVIAKATGISDAADHPLVAVHLQSAAQRATEFSYVELAASDDSVTIAQSPGLSVRFDSAWVQGILKDAGLPLWQAERPGILAWVLLDTGNGYFFATPQSNPAVGALLQQLAWQRGLDLAAPDYSRGWSAEDAARDSFALRDQAPEHRGARALIRYRFTSDGLHGSALFQTDPYSYSFQATSSTMEGMLAELIGRFADDYAADKSYTSMGRAVLDMEVADVASFADYSNLLRSLEQFEMIDRVEVLGVRQTPGQAASTTILLRIWHDASEDYARRTLQAMDALRNRSRLLPPP